MRKLLQIAAYFSFLLCGLAPAAYAQDYTTGLVGHWKLDETSGTTATDSSAGARNGTMNGGQSASSNAVPGKDGGALSFDGVDDSISIGGSLSLGGSNQATMSAWVKSPTPIPVGAGILYKANSVFEIYTDSSGRIYVSIQNGTAFHNAIVTSAYTDWNTWHHIAAVYNGTNVILYRDGVQIAISGTETGNLANSTGTLFIGVLHSSALWKGNIDDARIYNRALSAADIAALYAAAASTNYTCVRPIGATGQIIYNNAQKTLQYCNETQWVGIGPSTNILDGLVGHWALDETSGTTATDSSASGNNGTMTNMSGSANAVTGTVGTALSFSSSSITAGAAATNFDNIFAGGGTISYWVYPTNWGTFGRVVDKSDSGTFPPNSGWHTQGSTGLIKFSQAFSGTEGDWESAAASVPMNTWSHIAISYNSDSAANTPRIFVNGSEVTVTTITAPAGTAVSDAPNPITLGARQGGGNPYTGYTDDVRMYDRTILVSEIQSLYNLRSSCSAATSGLVGHWTLNETTGSTIADSSGNNNTGAWNDGADNNVTGETIAGINGTALTFNTNSARIGVVNSASLSLNDTLSLSFWLKAPIGGVHFGRALHKINTRGFSVRQNNNTSTLAIRFDTSAATNTVTALIPNVFDNTWHHIVYVIDSGNVSGYKDGVLTITGTYPHGTGLSNTGTLYIGNDTSNTQLEGQLDDARIYNRALSPTEIASLYGATGGTCSVATCANPFGEEGAITYNTTHNVMQYCNGRNWIAFSRAGNGGGGCSNPSGVAGSLVYNNTSNFLQYCEGDQWMAVGGDISLMDGLLAYWKLDETSGAAIADSSGNGYNGTWTDGGDNVVSGADIQSPARNGTGLNFNGNNSNYIQHNSRLNDPANLTLAGWVNINSLDTSGSTLINIGGKAVIEFFSNRVEGSYESAGAVWRRTSYGNDILGDGWTHVAWAFDDNNNTQTLYINGVAAANSAYTESIDWSTATNTNTYIARHNSTTNYHLIGSMDDVRVYNRALTAAEISTLYNSY